MSEAKTLARPYARAAFEYAKANDVVGAWQSMLQRLSALVSDEQMQGVMVSPKVDAVSLSALVQAVMGDALGKAELNFCKILVDNKRLAIVPEVLALFDALKAADEKRVSVAVSTAVAMNDQAEKAFIEALKKSLSQEVDVQFKIDEALIAGALVRMNDTVIDGSVRKQLDRLKALF